ncbi:uncharacterized protein C5L36_0D03005 [Pichia kudriavzevii]|uniref:Uncharacterized protein n=1 Tax=Pichia kudriavzevii TaxID=4909 RepID=A0A2U9R8N0_PICKU|nr:uncharacterized protein C5L36_0D03005 [Pichia kudriavzevii]AWU77561.1 hypothetical protein C5L36_0D03005 [Pichia kudriavzevii]
MPESLLQKVTVYTCTCTYTHTLLSWTYSSTTNPGMSECSVYELPPLRGFVLSIGLGVLIFGTYVPQHIRILKRRTSEGLSPSYILLGSAASVASLINIFIFTMPARRCCPILTRYECMSSLSGFCQILIQTSGSLIIFLLCIFATRESLIESRADLLQIRRNFKILIGYVLANVVTYEYIMLSSLSDDNLNRMFQLANLNGVASMLMALMQYIPQLFTTYSLKHPGSLSIPMLCLQAPGGMLWSYSLWVKTNSQWSSWLPYLVSAVMQTFLLCMCLYFKHVYPTELLETIEEQLIAEENLHAGYNTLSKNI